MENFEMTLPEECGREESTEQLERIIEGLNCLPVGENSWVRSYAARLEDELERRKEEEWQQQNEAG